jgi:hypothetical protein
VPRRGGASAGRPPIQCGMSAIRSPAVRSPAHDDREKHARRQARPSRIHTGVTCPCELCSPRAQQRFRERFSTRQLGLACAWQCRVQGTPGWNTPPSIGSSNKRPQLPQAGAVSLGRRAELKPLASHGFVIRVHCGLARKITKRTSGHF